VFGVRSRSSRLGRAGEGRYFVAERIPVGRKAWRNSGPGLRCVSGLPGVSSVLWHLALLILGRRLIPGWPTVRSPGP